MNMALSLRSQVRRGINQAGFAYATLLLLYSLFFVHTDASLFFEKPLVYFADGGFYYHFITSFWMGLSHFMIPIASVIAFGFVLCEDRDSGFDISSIYRQGKGKYYSQRLLASMIVSALVVLVACVVFICFLLLTTDFNNYGTGQIEAAQQSAYGWRALEEYFYVFVAEQVGRLMLAASTWGVIAVGFSAIWSNRAFVFLSTFGLSILADVYLAQHLGGEFTLAYIQTPHFSTQTDIGVFFHRQLIFFIAALVFAGIVITVKNWHRLNTFIQNFWQRIGEHYATRDQCIVHCPFVAEGTRWSRLQLSIRTQFSLSTILPAVVVPILVMLSNTRVGFSTIGDALLYTFGGIPWFDPFVNFQMIGMWLMILLPPIIGVAINTQKKLIDRRDMEIYRFASKLEWWSMHVCSTMLYVLFNTFIMFLSVTAFAALLGSKELVLFMEDANGFISPEFVPILQMFLLFTLHVIALCLLQVLFQLVTNRMQAGVLVALVPALASLVRNSNIEHLKNMSNPYNWGMIGRSTLFSPSTDMTGSGEVFRLAAFELASAFRGQSLLVVVFLVLQSLALLFIKVTERRTDG